MSSIPIVGVCPDEFAAVRAAFEANFARRDEVGASVAVCIDGEMVVDLWGGWIDEARTRPWKRDTLVCVFSSSKTVTALCALLIADRGGLDIDAPIQRYWPQFSASEVTLRHCLAHTAGLPGLDEPMEAEALYDWEKITSALARQAPWWKPGSMWAYHGLTQGYLVGEVVRRVTGRTIGQLLSQELAGPLAADFHIGLGPEHDARVAPIIPGPEDPPIEAPPGTLQARLARRNPVFRTDAALETPWRRTEIPAGNGYGTARALAHLQSVLACGGQADGRRFLSAEGARAAAALSWRGLDAWGQVDVGFGLGFALNLGPLKYGTGDSCFWGGAGGSMVVVDFERRMSFAYVMNRMKAAPFGDARNVALTAALYGALGAAQAA
jgi:CubicO group peptidase (beta-lactamase class C family)